MKGEIANLAGVIASSHQSPALLAELHKREKRLEEISEQIETLVLNGLKDIQKRLTGETQRAKAELVKHCGEITLTPEGKTHKFER